MDCSVFEDGEFRLRHCLILSFLALFCITHCQSDCVRRCGLDPVEVDLKRYKKQRAELSQETNELMSRVDEFEDKVFVNQRAALDLLRADLTERTSVFARKFAGIRVETDVVREVYEKELEGYKNLAKAYRVLQNAFETNDASSIRKGLKLREKGLRLVRGAEMELNKLERKYWRHP